MNKLINFGIVIGVFLILLQLAHFLIRPHQAAAIRSFLEDLTLWLDDIEVSNISDRLSEPGIHILLFLTGYSGYLLYILISVATSHVTSTLLQAPSPFGQVDGARLATVLILTVTIVLVFWRMPFRQIVTWAIAAEKPIETRIRLLRLRPALIFFGGALLFLFLDLRLKQIPDHSEWWHIPIAMFAYITFSIAFATSVAKQVLKERRGFLLKYVLFVSKQFLWRVVEYQKGPIAAIVLIATTLLIIAREGV